MTFADEAKITRETTCRSRKTFEHACHNIDSGHCWPNGSNGNERGIVDGPVAAGLDKFCLFDERNPHILERANTYAPFMELPLG